MKIILTIFLIILPLSIINAYFDAPENWAIGSNILFDMLAYVINK